MTQLRIVVLSAGVALAAGVTVAVAGTPFGGDDLGTIPTDSPKGPVTKCESGVAKAASKLAGSILKCHTARARGKLASETAEDACETTALTTFGATKTAGCAACTNLTTLGAAIEAALDSNNNKVACTATGTPFGGDDTGNIPADAPKGPVTKCEGGVGKAVGKLVGSIVKCHIGRARGKLTDNTAEDACEATAKTKFGTTKATGCDPCLGALSTLGAFVEAQADGALNALVWCGGAGGTALKGALTSTTGRFNYNAMLGLPGANAACNTNFAGTHACTYQDLQNAAAAGDLKGLTDIAGMTVTTFWAIDSSAPPLQQCNDDVNSHLNWEYATFHTASRGEKVDLDNAAGTLGSLQMGLQCNISGNAWVGCCQ